MNSIYVDWMNPRRHRLAGGDMPRERQQLRRIAVLAVLFSQGCAVLARSPTSHDDLCTGTSPTTSQPLGVYIYPIPEAPKSESFYQAGYEQYATELVIPRMLRASKHVVSDPSNASLFLVPNQGVRPATRSMPAGAVVCFSLTAPPAPAPADAGLHWPSQEWCTRAHQRLVP